ncbi:hypothetical protein CKO_03865 [Citrobacter koseri ATCC BAA-895]|uniref:Uncharacterized protein n=1 Tax=Citrobacter koseri (strain ATCC BAA-895 / CDC 4225-83 / SGSC4696) TaxID=290338 RepID=A8AN78_CITK8|nr:hypothetical protein CKO_03865 [Citrobacter koseri ATCC BAA-895]
MRDGSEQFTTWTGNNDECTTVTYPGSPAGAGGVQSPADVSLTVEAGCQRRLDIALREREFFFYHPLGITRAGKTCTGN